MTGSRYKLAAILFIGLCLALLLVRCTNGATQGEQQAPSPATANSPGVLFQDEFLDPNSGWPTEDRGSVSFGYQAPAFYFLEVGVPNESLVVFREMSFDNFAAEVKLVVNFTGSQAGDFHYGLAFRRSGERYYAFLISPHTRTWRILKHSSTGADVLAEAKNDSISGLYRLYTLNVEANGAKLSFQINGQSIIELTDPDYAAGEVGFIVETFDEPQVRVVYDSLLIQEIEVEVPATVTSAALAPLPGQTGSAPIATGALNPTSSVTSTATPMSLTLLPTLLPTVTPTPLTLLPTLLPTATPAGPTSTPSLASTATPTTLPTSRPSPLSTTTPVPTTVTPGLVPTAAATSTPTPGLSTGTFVLLNPLDPADISYGPTDFKWEWSGAVPAGYGFEVRVWRMGEPVVGAHDAVLDNQNDRIVSLGNNTYRLSLDIRGAAGVQGRTGEYLWTVALVQISPNYADQGQQATPARLRFEAGGSGDGGGGGNGGGGGVGID